MLLAQHMDAANAMSTTSGDANPAYDTTMTSPATTEPAGATLLAPNAITRADPTTPRASPASLLSLPMSRPPLGVHTIKAQAATGPVPWRRDNSGDRAQWRVQLGQVGIARCLQAILPDPWLAFGTDNLVQAMPMSLQTSAAGIEFARTARSSSGRSSAPWRRRGSRVSPRWRNAGARIIVDEVFVGGAASQQRWKNALGTLQVLWVAVRCDATVAAGRELARGDRIIGMAASQAELVHRGIVYDLQVDTTRTEALECAQAIAAHVQ